MISLFTSGGYIIKRLLKSRTFVLYVSPGNQADISQFKTPEERRMYLHNPLRSHNLQNGGPSFGHVANVGNFQLLFLCNRESKLR